MDIFVNSDGILNWTAIFMLGIPAVSAIVGAVIAGVLQEDWSEASKTIFVFFVCAGVYLAAKSLSR